MRKIISILFVVSISFFIFYHNKALSSNDSVLELAQKFTKVVEENQAKTRPYIVSAIETCLPAKAKEGWTSASIKNLAADVQIKAISMMISNLSKQQKDAQFHAWVSGEFDKLQTDDQRDFKFLMRNGLYNGEIFACVMLKVLNTSQDVANPTGNKEKKTNIKKIIELFDEKLNSNYFISAIETCLPARARAGWTSNAVKKLTAQIFIKSIRVLAEEDPQVNGVGDQFAAWVLREAQNMSADDQKDFTLLMQQGLFDGAAVGCVVSTFAAEAKK